MTVYTLFLYVAIAGVAFTATLGVGHSKLKKHPVIHPVQWFVQYFLGALLIFSALVKGVDPLGTAYKMQDYFTEFSNQGLPFMDLMHDNALAFSLFMLVLELVLGICLILGLGQRKTTWANLAMMIFFTVLTGFNYLTGYTSKPDEVGLLDFANWGVFSDANIRITDCGCFGDFMKLKPIETFSKDIIFLIMSTYLMWNTSKMKELFPRDKMVGPINLRTIIVSILVIISSWFCLQNFYLNIPMVDFRPFAEGIDLRAAKEACDQDAPIVKTIFVYKNKKSGEEIEISSDDLVKPENKFLWTPGPNGEKDWEPDNDKRKDVTIKEGCTSQIQYFNFPEVLEESGYNILVVGGNLEKTDRVAFRKIAKLASAAKQEQITTRAFYYYSGKQTIEEFKKDVNAEYDFMTADDKLIKTIIRSNPGVLLLKDGKVVKKWHSSHIPDYAELKGNYMN